jgi:hypothetical protein
VGLPNTAMMLGVLLTCLSAVDKLETMVGVSLKLHQDFEYRR